MSKAGCTTWQKILSTRFKDKTSRHNRRVPSYDKQFADSKHFRFINIRHPFERLLSAYFNTVRKRHGEARGPGWRQLNYLSKYFNVSHHNITLTQFLSFIASPSNRHPRDVYFDRHWDSYARSCKVCSIDFNYILRTETSSFDSEDVLERVGYPRHYLQVFKPLNKNPERSINQTATKVSDTLEPPQFNKILAPFSSIDRNLLKKVYDRFRLDFEAFGYHFDFEENVAHCSIKINSTHACC